MEIEVLRARRDARRRAIRRRRRMAAGVIVAMGAVAAAIVVLSDNSNGKAHGHRTATPLARAGERGARTDALPAASTTARASAGPPGTEPVPILMYHVIAAPPPGAPFPGLYVEPAEFAEQMLALKHAGWHAVTLDQVEAYWRRGVPLGAGRPIVLSFDNGYNSQYTQALPVLRRLGWVGEENIQLSGLPPSQGGLGPQQVRGLLAAGWELDTQGISHADLVTLDAQQLHYQVAVARHTLQQRYGIPVNWFCYPSGDYDQTVVEAVRAAGFIGSTTVVPGWAHPSDDPYSLHRLRVLGGTTAHELLELITDAREDPPAPSSYTA
ncbi:MAG TPA: polysaccharide deacetylase family protein [Solirubrobacteraceae bacterium]|jgi:peptidoglycan/xylan/chitin deacetylase (PgdA/CDA1 family)|nr:polysaccharide deacetylase family protein [Solirubrobacteraceae bacterium]